MAFNVNKFVKDSTDYKDHKLADNGVEMAVIVDNKRPVKKKKASTPATVTETPISASSSMSYLEQKIPYASAYADTNRQLDETINQLNILGTEIVTDLNLVRSNKTLRNKYNYINDMTQTASSIISNKLTAIREKNNIINSINKFELDRLKQLKTTSEEEDDTTRIANLYDAFINTPVGSGPMMLGPSVQDIMIGNSAGANIPVTSIGNDQQIWEQGLNPAENRMVLEAKGAIETVVMFDQATGNRWFEVIDKSTGQPMANVEKPDNSYIYDLDLNIRGGFAKDANRKTTYKLICINGDNNINEY